ncbi:MAG TPA: carboxypeptidase-like regulatory domain-containing protein [Saprospiraceae bacterium]|nr:carboxypeptidase-like regulatory domain-containing protein [Saprospiraceae bacterium]
MFVKTHCILVVCIACQIGLSLNGTAQDQDNMVVQFSGIVLTDEHGPLEPLPYVNVYIQATRRGTFTGSDGFFSLVGRKGQVVIFSSVGYKDVEYLIPDTLSSDRYSIFQIMTRDTVLLPETFIYPWPSREHFKLEFLAMDITNELEDRAAENLSERALAQMMLYLPSDGDENVDFYLRQQAESYYYAGQVRPIQVLNAFAWKQFIDALKRGDFKRKK